MQKYTFDTGIVKEKGHPLRRPNRFFLGVTELSPKRCEVVPEGCLSAAGSRRRLRAPRPVDGQGAPLRNAAP
jgi:hypothetical protein